MRVAGYSHAGEALVSAGFTGAWDTARDRLDHPRRFGGQAMVGAMVEGRQGRMTPDGAFAFLRRGF